MKTIPDPLPKKRNINPDLEEILKRIDDLGKRVELLEITARSSLKQKNVLDTYLVLVEDEHNASVPYIHNFIYLPKTLTWEQINMERKKYYKRNKSD